MRAIVITRPGGPEVLSLAERPIPLPGPGDIRIAVQAFGLNRAELYFRSGAWGDVAEISGIECVGRVDADPAGRLAAGTRVIALMGGLGRSRPGSYAEYVCVPAPNVVPVDSPLSWTDLAALPESYATAWTCLADNLRLAASDLLVIRGASSALGQAALNIAAHQGARVIATTRRADRTALLRRLGAAHVLVAGGEAIAGAVRGLAPGGADAVLDLIGTASLPDSLAMTRRGGHVCLAGFLGGGGRLDGFDPVFQIPSGVQLSVLASALVFGGPDYPLAGIPWPAIADRAARGDYQAGPAAVFRFDEIVAAHRLMESDAAGGKIVIAL